MPVRIAILGGGQLAKMTAQAASALGIESLIWSAEQPAPAFAISPYATIGSLNQETIRRGLIEDSDVITLESEFVPAEQLRALQAAGGRVLPRPESIAVIQDKWLQKSALAEAGLPVAKGLCVPHLAAAHAAAEELGFPFMVKARRLGYDGHGTVLVREPTQLESLFAQHRPGASDWLAESWIDFSHELSLVVVRGLNDDVATYPLVKTLQPQFVCEEVWAPAPVCDQVAAAAHQIAMRAAVELNTVGVMAVEMFLDAHDNVIINELAPRPHNSGHFSIEACETSQFENHVRAVCGFPLGLTDLRAPAAVMVNILGRREEMVSVRQLAPALSVPGVHLHFYGKRQSRLLRKLGHITVLAPSLAEARERALTARNLIPF